MFVHEVLRGHGKLPQSGPSHNRQASPCWKTSARGGGSGGYIVNGLPTEPFGPFVMTIEARSDSELKVEETATALRGLARRFETKGTTSVALAVPHTPKCRFCSASHFHRDCPKAPTCYNCGTKGHVRKHYRKPPDILKAKKDKVSLYSLGMPWIVDSGASFHMTGKQSVLTDIQPSSYEMVVDASGTSLRTTSKGRLRDAPTLDDVCLVPGLQYNLLSTHAATSRGYQVILDEMTCKFIKNGKVCLVANKNPSMGGLYTVDLSENCPTGLIVVTEPHGNQGQAASINEWHSRLGHINTTQIQRLQAQELVSGLKLKP